MIDALFAQVVIIFHNMGISENIQRIRQEKGISQSKVAEAIGMERTNYFRHEKRGNKLTVEQLEKIAEALGVSVMELITGEPQKVEDTGKVRELEKRVGELEDRIKDKDSLLKLKDRNFETIQGSVTSFIYYKVIDYFSSKEEFEFLGVKILNRETSKTEAVLDAKDIDELPKDNDPFFRFRLHESISKRYALKHQLDANSISIEIFLKPSKRLHAVYKFLNRGEPLDEIANLLLEMIAFGLTNDAILNFIYMEYRRGDYEGTEILSEEDEEEWGRAWQEYMLLSEEEKEKLALGEKKARELDFENYLYENVDRLKHEPERIFKL